MKIRMDGYTQFDNKASEEQALIKKLRLCHLNAKQTGSYKYDKSFRSSSFGIECPAHC
jgi:hypothetical protein